ncbi:MAG TPA: DUF6659 family protein [Nitrosopumilaceae archaeon]|nr:DUF6659 family protein [Nitrosopumilaceae archaeon]
MNYKNFCSQILELDPKIRFAAVYDSWAKLVAGGLREGLTSQISKRDENELVNLSIINWKARKDMSKSLGKTIFTLAEHEKIKRFSFYLGEDHLLLLSTEKDANTDTTVDKIIKLYHKIQD